MSDHICPVWVGYLLANPLRQLVHNPSKILGPYINAGDTVLDVGSAMGFFSIPAAQMVGESGRVVCVDCQQKMIDSLKKRARRAKVTSRIETRVCSPSHLGTEDLKGQVDLALAFAMVHEAPNPTELLTQISSTLKPNGKLFVAEPKAHVSPKKIDETLAIADSLGLKTIDKPIVRQSVSFVFGWAA